MSNVKSEPTPEMTLSRDEFSTEHRRLSNNPGGVTRFTTIELEDFYGNSVTWVIKTIRVEGQDTVFLQRQDGQGGQRLVLPPKVSEVLARQRESATTVNRKRGAQRGAATRKALGMQPSFLKKVAVAG
jgi:hypothetical protein